MGLTYCSFLFLVSGLGFECFFWGFFVTYVVRVGFLGCGFVVVSFAFSRYRQVMVNVPLKAVYICRCSPIVNEWESQWVACRA